jgi:hypothetical protein
MGVGTHVGGTGGSIIYLVCVYVCSSERSTWGAPDEPCAAPHAWEGSGGQEAGRPAGQDNLTAGQA